MEEFKQLIKYRKIIVLGIGLFYVFVIFIVLYELTIGGSNNVQSVGENSTSSVNKGETGVNSIFSLLCENCGSGDTASGVLGSDFYKKMSELMNFYNNLELEEERVDELDFPLLVATIGYGKKMSAEIFQDSEKFGSWASEDSLTNRDINFFALETDINLDNAQSFYKWASVMLGTPYSLPDINFRGLSGNLVTGKVVSTCVSSGSGEKVQTEEELIEEIIRIEKKFSGDSEESASLWDKILTIFGIDYAGNEEALEDRLKGMLENLGNSDSEYADLEPYVNLDFYDPNLTCQGGTQLKHIYTKFMNYNQYKVYLEEVYVPETYINCEECILRGASDTYKKIRTTEIINDIFEMAEYYRLYSDMAAIDYDQVIEENEQGISKIPGMTSPLKSSCTITSPYGMRGVTFHGAVDTTSGGTVPLYAVADGVVEKVIYYTSETLAYNAELGFCPDPNNPSVANNLSSGIEVIIRHEIDGITYRSRYVHLAPNSVTVSEGQEVKQGDKIANMGNTGCSTGQHLHFELSANGEIIDPSALFSQCEGSSAVGVLKIETTDNFVTPEKCTIGNLTLDEIITGLIKKDYSGASNNPEYVKSLAIVIRTKLMDKSNWCNNPIDVDVNVDIQGNTDDLLIYSYVIDTQGMVLNYSGSLIKNVDYAKFPCEKLPVNSWQQNQTKVFNAIGWNYQNEDSETIVAAINEYNKGCINYNGSGTIWVQLSTIPKYLTDDYTAIIELPESQLPDPGDRYAQNKFATLSARYYESLKHDYTAILNKFYVSKTKDAQGEYIGEVDLTTSPGLIDAKLKLLESLNEENSQ